MDPNVNYAVESFFINVRAGDAAIHILCSSDQNGAQTAIKAVLVDSGKGTSGEVLKNLMNAPKEIQDYQEINGWDGRFDAVVITHWDSDHYQGLINWLENVYKAPPTNQIWKPGFLKFTGNTPKTVFYAPNWNYNSGLSVTGGNVFFRYGGEQHPIGMAAGDRGPAGDYDFLGWDIFGSSEQASPSNKQSESIKALADWQTGKHGANPKVVPRFCCIAQNNAFLFPKGRTTNSLDPDEIDVLGKRDTSKYNYTSIALMLIWPETYHVSLYTAGDLDDPGESLILQWANLDGSLNGSITTVKLSHHGAATSTPLNMLENFNPQNLIISAGSDYGHPRWEILFYMLAWNYANRVQSVAQKQAGDNRTFYYPLIATAYPYWLTQDDDGDWTVLPFNKCSLKALEATGSDYLNHLAALWQKINTWFDTSRHLPDVSMINPVDEFRAELVKDPSMQRYEKMQWLSSNVSTYWEFLSAIRPTSYVDAKGWDDGLRARADIFLIRISNNSNASYDGEPRAVFETEKNEAFFRRKSAKKDFQSLSLDATGALSGSLEGTDTAKTGTMIPTLLPRISSPFPSAGFGIVQDMYVDNYNVNPDEAWDPPDTGKNPTPQALSYPTTLEWISGSYLVGDRVNITPPSGVGWTKCKKGTTDIGYFLQALHSGWMGLAEQAGSDGYSKLVDTDEIPSWLLASLNVDTSSVAVKLTTQPNSPTSSTTKSFTRLLDDIQFSLTLFKNSHNQSTLAFDTTNRADAFYTSATDVDGSIPQVYDQVIVERANLIVALNPNMAANSSGKKVTTTLSDLLAEIKLHQSSIVNEVVLTLELDYSETDSTKGQRNAIWFIPESHYLTIFRSVWSVPQGSLDSLNKFMAKFHSTINVQSASVIASKRATWDLGKPEYDSTAIFQLSLKTGIANVSDPLNGYICLNKQSTKMMIDFGATVTAAVEDVIDWVLAFPTSSTTDADAAKPDASGIGATKTGGTQTSSGTPGTNQSTDTPGGKTTKPKSPPANTVAPKPAGSEVSSWLAKLGGAIRGRRVSITLDEHNNWDSCQVVIEVDFPVKGAGDATTTAASLFTFYWDKSRGFRLSGSFFPPRTAQFKFNKLYMPGFESFADLYPSVSNPASIIPLSTLIPGTTISQDDLPEVLNVGFEALKFSVSGTDISFYATIAPDSYNSTKDDSSTSNSLNTSKSNSSPSSNNTSDITNSSTTTPVNDSGVPHLRLGELNLGATYSFDGTFHVSFDLTILLNGDPKAQDVSQFPINAAMLIGKITYTGTTKGETVANTGDSPQSGSNSSWVANARVQNLPVATLFEFFDSDSQDDICYQIGHIDIAYLELTYRYAGKMPSDFIFIGILLMGPLELELIYKFAGKTKEHAASWDFTASAELKGDPDAPKAYTINHLIADLGNPSEDPIEDLLPEWIGDIDLASLSITLTLTLHKQLIGTELVLFLKITLKIGEFEILFLQFKRQAAAKAKRLFRATLSPSVTSIQNVPIVDTMSLPFDELYFLYASGATPEDGITKEELAAIEKFLAPSPPLVIQTGLQPSKEKGGDDTLVVIRPGFHFVVASNVKGVPTAELDYLFHPNASSTSKPQPTTNSSKQPLTPANDNGDNEQPKSPSNESNTDTPAANPSSDSGNGNAQSSTSSTGDNSSGKAKLNKTIGPITIKDIGLKFSDGQLGVILNATLVMGPVEMDLVGFAIMFDLGPGNFITHLKAPTVSLTGMAVAFNKPPVSIAGSFASQPTPDSYAGGLGASFAPYELLAAGAYGELVSATNKSETFKTVAVFAQLNGPLIELEFAEISGICGGFGYNSYLQPPNFDTLLQFPFIQQPQSSYTNALDVISGFQQGGWITPQDDSFWLAAGLTLTSLQALNVKAVITVKFDPTVKLGIYADAIGSFPPESSGHKFLYVEIGIASMVDFAAGSMVVLGKLAPTSYILDPSCHLTGGFAICYWFGDSAYAGDWLYTIGGYHPSFRPPSYYPAVDRLQISWSLDSSLSITGQSYFALTPKVLMAGMSIHVALSLGPLSATFDAWADFLINFNPFYFQGSGGVEVHVLFTLDLWITSIHFDSEISATLEIMGPPTHGMVHVDFFVFGFNVHFGDEEAKPDPLTLQEFYTTILLPSSGQNGTNDHTVSCKKGLVAPQNFQVQPQTVGADTWMVRGGKFTFGITSCFPFTKADIAGGGAVQDMQNQIYSKPMQTTSSQQLHSKITVTIGYKDTKSGNIAEALPFRVVENAANLPSAIWGPYSTENDPTVAPNGNQIPSLLDGSHSTIHLMNGITVIAPKSVLAHDIIPAFNVVESNKEIAETCYQRAPSACSDSWSPCAPASGAQDAQWQAIFGTWGAPEGGSGVAQTVATMISTAMQWQGPGTNKPPVAMVGTPPASLIVKDVFEMDYLAAPMLSCKPIDKSQTPSDVGSQSLSQMEL